MGDDLTYEQWRMVEISTMLAYSGRLPTWVGTCCFVGNMRDDPWTIYYARRGGDRVLWS